MELEWSEVNDLKSREIPTGYSLKREGHKLFPKGMECFQGDDLLIMTSNSLLQQIGKLKQEE